MNAEEILSAISSWKDESKEKRSDIVILIDEIECGTKLSTNAAIIGSHNKIVSSIKAIMKESLPLRQIIEHVIIGCIVEKTIKNELHDN